MNPKQFIKIGNNCFDLQSVTLIQKRGKDAYTVFVGVMHFEVDGEERCAFLKQNVNAYLGVELP